MKELLFTMIRIRKIEEKIAQLYPFQEMECPVHLCIGQEAIAAGVCAAMGKKDVIFCAHRSHGYYIALGGSLKALFAELYGRSSGCAEGKGGSQHLVAPEIGLLGSSAIVAGTIPIAVGVALSFSMQKKNRVALAAFGDGAVDQGVFYESLNFAALKKLPVVFICENNLYATHAHQSARQAKDNIVMKAKVFGVDAKIIDGNDVQEVFLAARGAIGAARSGKGPVLIEARTYRWLEHVGPDYDYHLGYRTERELKQWMKKCPIKRFKKLLLQKRLITERELVRNINKIDSEIEKAVIGAKNSSYPLPDELFKDVYSA
jgi:pyruvate dehydrogenase E1 component alpha subunit